MQKINLGIIGCGVVGTGVVQILQQHAKVIEQRLGARLVITAIADTYIKRRRDIKLPKGVLTTDGMALCTDPAIDIIIELVGGTGIAGQFVEAALKHGKHVITANKALLSEKGTPLFKLAEKQSLQLLFEAAVGGTIPVIRTIKQDLAGDQIERMYGILNGTCNFILSKMAAEGADFAPTLKEAQQLGFAEADPTLDVSGGDTAHKLALLAMLAWGTDIPFKKIHTEGITELSAADFAFAKRLGRVIKLVAVGKRNKDDIELRVHPTLLPADSMLAKIDGSTNAVMLHAAAAGDVLLSGAGAGSLPTASAVVGDIIEAARTVIDGSTAVPNRGMQPDQISQLPIKPIGETVSGFYLRFVVKDQSGIIQSISAVLVKYKLSIRDILQLDLHEFTQAVPLAIVLHPAQEQTVRLAIRELNKLRCMAERVVVLRVED